MSTNLILVLGATGAQGVAVINALLAPSADGSPSPYKVRALTRDPFSRRAQEVAAKGVELAKGDTNDLSSIEAALRDAYGACVNVDDFTSMRVFELAKHHPALYLQQPSIRHKGLLSNALSGYGPEYRVEHLDAKGRVAERLKMQSSVVSDDDLSWSIVTTGPYREMLNDDFFGPLNRRADGTTVFVAPSGEGRVPLVSLIDIGFFACYSFDHREEVSKHDLEIVSEIAHWDAVAEAFTEVTGHQAIYKRQTVDEWIGNFNTDKPVSAMGAAGSTSWATNFGNFWKCYRDGIITKDVEWNKKMNPNALTIEKWMKLTQYNGSIMADTLKLAQDNNVPISTNVEKIALL